MSYAHKEVLEHVLGIRHSTAVEKVLAEVSDLRSPEDVHRAVVTTYIELIKPRFKLVEKELRVPIREEFGFRLGDDKFWRTVIYLYIGK
jgi:hypothetical protein